MAIGSHIFSFFFILGIVYVAIGLANKDKWKANHKNWKQLSKSEKKVKTIILILLGLLVLLGLFAYLYLKY